MDRALPSIGPLGEHDLTVAVVDDVTELLADLVEHGAALGWVEPPPPEEVGDLLAAVAPDAARGNGALLAARADGRVVGLGWWRRYARPTHRPHADLEKVAVARAWQGAGLGRRLTEELVAAAGAVRVEVLTLDLRGDNDRARGIYESLGFRCYGRLPAFVAVGEARYDKLLYSLDLRAEQA